MKSCISNDMVGTTEYYAKQSMLVRERQMPYDTGVEVITRSKNVF